MDKKLKIELIKKAQHYLVTAPQDYLHDITHHYRTVLLAKEISANISQELDLDLLEILCWWHDVRIPDLVYGEFRVAKVVGEYLSKLVPEEYKSNVLDSIENHEFGSNPSFIEGKILQDADKLETLSVERITLGIDAVEAGFFDKEKVLGRFNEFIQTWVPKMPERYNFEYSKKKHFVLLEQVQPELNKLAEYLKS